MKTQVTINTRGSMDVFNVLASAGIIATCDAHMNMVVSDTDLARIRNEYPAAWDDMYVVNDERVDDVECTRDGHQGITITYTLDGVPYEVTGEFLIDKAGVLHHWCEDADGDEIEVCVQYN